MIGAVPAQDDPRRDRGVALLIVVAALAIMAVLAAGLIGAVREQAHLTRRAMAGVVADGAMEGAMWAVVARLLEDNPLGADEGADTPQMPDFLTARGTEIAVGAARVRVRLRLEAAKLDLNLADERQLAALLRAAGLGDSEAVGVAAAIADWRDADDFLRNRGAERREYAAAGREGMPPNRPFRDVSEVAGVLGLPALVAACILPDLSLFAGGGTVREAGASPLMRQALGLAPTGGAELADMPSAGDVIAVEARIAGEGGADRHARRWILRITGNMAEPVQVLERRDLGPIEAAADRACPPGLGPARL